jgi:hypothetical protein
MKMDKSLYQKVSSIDLVDYLSSLGHSPVKVRGSDYWYYSPFRQEKDASFKVNRDKNIWYDHGIAKGGNLMEFGKIYHSCLIEDFVKMLLDFLFKPLPFHNPDIVCRTSPGSGDLGVQIISDETIRNHELVNYLQKRNIPIDIARQFCSEIKFRLNGKEYLAIGFRNDEGGYELRNESFKGSSSPKSPTTIKSNGDEISVFEGFFDFLSFRRMNDAHDQPGDQLPKSQKSYLILNSLGYLEKSRKEIERFSKINLYLDRDSAGWKAARKALKWSPRYVDKSGLYKNFKDLNEFLMKGPGYFLREAKGRHI